jgi:hypothetical protein
MGPPTVPRLVERGHEVTVFYRGKTRARLPEGLRELTLAEPGCGKRDGYLFFTQVLCWASNRVTMLAQAVGHLEVWAGPQPVQPSWLC